jgi:ribosomal peptide maturation radical SAM protein 1
MYRICLINMPFSNLALPSIALTQLKSMVQAALGDRVTVDVLYLNVDFASYLGIELYGHLTNSGDSLNTGLGEWFFREAAFPELPDNSAQYFSRYFPTRTPEMQKINHTFMQKRQGINEFLDRLIAAHSIDQAQMVGFTSMFMQNVASFALARKLKALNPGLITVIGGANCEYPMGQVIADRMPQIDFVFSGPALKSFPEFVQMCMEGKAASGASIRGVLTRGAAGAKSGEDAVGEDLGIDAEIDLDYEPFLQKLHSTFPAENIKGVLPFETSRGCWWGERSHCTFCGLNGASMGYRAKHKDRALAELNRLFGFSGRVERLSAVDNILPKNYFQDVLPFLKTPSDMDIFYEVKADLSELDVALLARARVTHIQPGIEAMATSTLKLMKKGTTVFQNLKLLKLCALYGVSPAWNLLLGFPGETEDVYRAYVEKIPLLVHLPAPTGAYPVRFDRFSPYYNQAASYKLELQPLDFYSLVYPLDEKDLMQMAYYFSDRNVEAGYFLAVAKWIGKVRAKVEEWSARWSDAAAPPHLYFKDSHTVYDSRSRSVKEHVLEEGSRVVLDLLARPTRIEDIAKALSARPEIDVAGEVAWLSERGLIFREGDRMFSLVMEAERGSRHGQLPEELQPAREAAPANLVQIA